MLGTRRDRRRSVDGLTKPQAVSQAIQRPGAGEKVILLVKRTILGLSIGSMGKTADTNREVVRVMGKRDIAQAALFADILTAEVATLRAQLCKAEKQWDDRRGRSRCDVDTPARLVRLREQLEEAERLSALPRRLPGKKV